MNKKLIGIAFILFGVILVVLGVVKLMSEEEPTHEEKVTIELNEEQVQVLVKEMWKYLPESEDLTTSTKYTSDEMVSYAFSYTSYLDAEKVDTKIDEENAKGIANIEKIKTNVEYLFGVSLDVTKLTYEVKDGYVYVPLNLQGGDAQIYKYNKTEYDKDTDEYIVVIDCLEPSSAEDYSSILTKSEYNAENVIYTLKIKYKVVEGRKILLAYATYSNM